MTTTNSGQDKVILACKMPFGKHKKMTGMKCEQLKNAKEKTVKLVMNTPQRKPHGKLLDIIMYIISFGQAGYLGGKNHSIGPSH